MATYIEADITLHAVWFNVLIAPCVAPVVTTTLVAHTILMHVTLVAVVMITSYSIYVTAMLLLTTAVVVLLRVYKTASIADAAYSHQQITTPCCCCVSCIQYYCTYCYGIVDFTSSFLQHTQVDATHANQSCCTGVSCRTLG